jgi:type I restriction enzyme S subunit
MSSVGQSSVPPGWAACKLADAVVPGRPRGNPADFVGQPFIGLEHIEAHTTRMLGFVPAETMRSSGVQFSAGDVLYGRMRPYLNKVWLADRDGLCSGEFIVFPKTGSLRGAFLMYRLNAQDFVTFTDHATTGDRPRADFADFGKFPVLVPPLAEQIRIADRIDELFTDLAAGVAALERVKRNLSRYRAAVLHAAVTGRLTESWRKQHGTPDEPGPTLLERILAERRRQWERRTLAKYEKDGKQPPKGWRDRYSEPSPPKLTVEGTESVLPDLPPSWCWASLHQISDVTGGVAKNQKEAGGAGMRDVPYLRVANVQRGYLDLNEIKTISANAADIEELTLRPGDVLFTEGGDRDKLGRGWVWEGQIQECIHQNHIFRARPYMTELRSVLLSHAGNSYGQVWFRSNGIQSVNLASISLGVLRQFPIPLAPLAEQNVIVEAVNEKLSQIDGLEAEIERGLARAARLRQAILKAAFEGKLVPQDPADEPASVLLERIHAAADLADAPRRSRRTRGSPAVTNGVPS